MSHRSQLDKNPKAVASKKAKLAANDDTSAGDALNSAEPKAKWTALFIEQFPLDVMGEIFGILDPIDLLRLARTTRSLREFLMSRTSAVYWKRSRGNIPNLPPCPKTISEPQYANLMFSTQCHNCSTEEGDLLMYMEAWTQLCVRCSLDEFTRWDRLPVQVNKALVDFVPSTSEALTKFERRNKEARSPRFHIKSALALHESFKKCAETKEDQSAWLKKQKAIWRENVKAADACRAYFKASRDEERERLWKLREPRIEQLIQKVTDLGWGQEWDAVDKGRMRLSDSIGRTWFRLYRRVASGPARPFAEQDWEEIKDEMLPCLQRIRIVMQHHPVRMDSWRRIQEALVPAYEALLASNPPDPRPVLPKRLVLALMQDYLLHLGGQVDWDVPQAAIDQAISRLPSLVDSWDAEFRRRFLSIIKASPIYAGRDDLDWATINYASTVFRCKKCPNAVFSYPDLLGHACFYMHIFNDDYLPEKAPRKARGRRRATGNEVEDGVSTACLTAMDRVWDPRRHLGFHEAGYYHTISLLETLGRERTTTVQELKDLNPYVEGLCKCFEAGDPNKWYPRIRRGRAARWTDTMSSATLSSHGSHRTGKYTDSFRVFEDQVLQQSLGYSPNLCGSTSQWQSYHWETRCLSCWHHVGGNNFIGYLTSATFHNLTPAQGAIYADYLCWAALEPAYERYIDIIVLSDEA